MFKSLWFEIAEKYFQVIRGHSIFIWNRIGAKKSLDPVSNPGKKVKGKKVMTRNKFGKIDNDVQTGKTGENGKISILAFWQNRSRLYDELMGCEMP